MYANVCAVFVLGMLIQFIKIYLYITHKVVQFLKFNYNYKFTTIITLFVVNPERYLSLGDITSSGDLCEHSDIRTVSH